MIVCKYSTFLFCFPSNLKRQKPKKTDSVSQSILPPESKGHFIGTFAAHISSNFNSTKVFSKVVFRYQGTVHTHIGCWCVLWPPQCKVSKEPAGDAFITGLYKWCICRKKCEIFWPSNCCLETVVQKTYNSEKGIAEREQTLDLYTKDASENPSPSSGMWPWYICLNLSQLVSSAGQLRIQGYLRRGKCCGSKDTTRRRDGHWLASNTWGQQWTWQQVRLRIFV